MADPLENPAIRDALVALRETVAAETAAGRADVHSWAFLSTGNTAGTSLRVGGCGCTPALVNMLGILCEAIKDEGDLVPSVTYALGPCGKSTVTILPKAVH